MSFCVGQKTSHQEDALVLLVNACSAAQASRLSTRISADPEASPLRTSRAEETACPSTLTMQSPSHKLRRPHSISMEHPEVHDMATSPIERTRTTPNERSNSSLSSAAGSNFCTRMPIVSKHNKLSVSEADLAISLDAYSAALNRQKLVTSAPFTAVSHEPTSTSP